MALPFFPTSINHRAKTFKKRTLLESMTEYEIRKHCGMSRESAISLFEVLEPSIRPSTNRGHSIPAETKFLTSMSFFRSGSFQYIEGSIGGVSQSSISRIIEEFSSVVVSDFLPQFVSFSNENADLNKSKATFFEKSLLPNICGLIDGTHVNIKAPGDQEHAFVNRKLKHSINLQVVCSEDYGFKDVVVRWPGSSHDSFIWKNSGLRQRFLQGEFGESWLLGDSGYPLEPWLMTPVENPHTDPEHRYNQAHKSTRSFVERAIGIWKIRFRSMHESGGTLCYTPQKCCQLISTSIFLHNFCIRNKIPLLPEDESALDYEEHDDMTSPVGIEDFTCGVRTRQNLIANYFTN